MDKPPGSYTDQEINEVADWWSALTLEQIFYIKKSYEALLKSQAREAGHEYVH
jgi:hypothetical protein